MTAWTEQQINDARQRAYEEDESQRGISDVAIKAIMSFALTLAASTGGRMTTTQIARWQNFATELRGGAADLANTILAHAAAQGASLEDLAARLDSVAAEREAQSEEIVRLRERLAAAEESGRELTHRAQDAESSLEYAHKTILGLRSEVADMRVRQVQSERLAVTVDAATTSSIQIHPPLDFHAPESSPLQAAVMEVVDAVRRLALVVNEQLPRESQS